MKSVSKNSMLNELLVCPQVGNPALTEVIDGYDHNNEAVSTRVITERAWTIFLNSQEIVTNMTIGDFPDYLAVGYLLNQNMLSLDNEITGIEVDDDLGVVVVRTRDVTDFEAKLRHKVRTSGCAQGTVFGDLMDRVDDIILDDSFFLRTSILYRLTGKINRCDSLYLRAGAIHGCVLCEGDRVLLYMEDVGRHNAVDKLAGYMYLRGVSAVGKVLYTTGRLTSEMVIKTVSMGISVLVSRSGFTAWGVELARKTNLTLIGRARGRRFLVLSGHHRLIYDGAGE